MLWYTDVEGLTLRGQFAWTDATNTGDFFNTSGVNLRGSERSYSPEFAGSLGFSYDAGLGAGWRVNLSSDARYSDDYGWGVYKNSPRQDSFWMNDAAISIYSEDGTHSFNLIGRNLGDEIVIVTGGSTPGRIGTRTDPSIEAALLQDQQVTTQQGRTVTLQYKYKM